MKNLFLKIESCLSKTLVISLLLLLVAGASNAQSVFSSGTNWMTAGNWTPSGVPSATGIAEFNNFPTSTFTVTIPMSASNNNGTDNQKVGAIYFTSAQAANGTFNPSTANGTLTIAGTTVNGIANCVVQNNSAKNLIIGSGTSQNLTVSFPSTTNIFSLGGSGKIEITCPYTGSGLLSFGGTTASTYTVSASNSGFTGTYSISGGEEVDFTGGADLNLGAVPSSTVANYFTLNAGILSLPNGTSAVTISSNRGITLANGTSNALQSSTSGNTAIYNGIITDAGSNSSGLLSKKGAGLLQLGGLNTYSCPTQIMNGTIQLGITNSLPPATQISIGQGSTSANVGVFDLNGYNQSVYGISSNATTGAPTTNNTITSSTTASTLTLTGSGSYTYGANVSTNSGVISGPVSIKMTGTGNQTFGGINTYTGSTSIYNGTLTFAPLGTTPSETLNGAADTLAGGTLATTGIAAGATLTFSTLNLTANSSITLASATAHAIKFADSHSITWAPGTTLTINGWQGSPNASGTNGQLFFGTGTGALTTVQLAQITFANVSGTTYNGAIQLSTGEVVPAVSCTAPSISAISSNTGVCAGSSLNFSLTAAGTATLSYAWTGPQGFTSSSANPSIATPYTTQSGTYSVTVTNSCGTATSTTVVAIDSVPVGLSVTNPGPICSGSTLTLSGSASNATSYSWSGPSGISITNNTTLSASVTAASTSASGTYTLTATNTCGSNTATTTATVNANLVPSVSISSNDGNSICAGTNVTYTAVPSNGGTSPTYQWYWNGSAISGATASTYSNSSLANGDSIRAVLTSNATCVTAANASSNEIVMTITSHVIPTVSVSATATTICSGNTVTFTANPGNGGATPTYTWYHNGSVVTGNTTAIYSNSSLSNNDSVRVVLNSSNGCALPSTANSAETIVTVNTPVTTSVTVSASPSANVCAGTSVLFTATPQNGGTPIYSWTLNGNAVGTNSSTYTDATPSNNDAVVCTMTSSLGCVTASSVNSTPINVTVNALPTPAISGASVAICSNAPATLDAGAGYASYLWSNAATTQTITETVAGTYSVTVTSSAGCSASTHATLTVNQAPKVLLAGTPLACNGVNTGTVAAEIVAGTTGTYTYSWSNGTQTTKTTAVDTIATLTSLAAGTYSVTVTSNNGCTATPKKLIHYWDFNSTLPCGGGGLVNVSPVSYSYSTLGHALIQFNQIKSPVRDSILDNVAGSTINERPGYNTNTCGGAVNDAIRTRNPDTEDTLKIFMPTTNYQNIVLSYACEVSSAGKDVSTYFYSLDSGKTFSNTGLAATTYTPGTTWKIQTIDLSGISGANNNPKFVFAIGNSVSATTGNMRYDNVTVDGDSLYSGQTIAKAYITQPALLSVGVAATNVNCYAASTGTATVTASGGTFPYTYKWSNAQTTATATGLVAGTYTVTVNDASTCSTSSIITTVTITQPSAALSAAVTSTNITCNGLANGTAALTASGGTPSYTYNWSNSATTANISGLSNATYSVTITDANACSVNTTVAILQPTTLSATISSSSNITCYGAANGTATATGNGGTTPYSYAWSNLATTSVVNGLANETYSVTVSDANACSASTTIIITQPTAPLMATVSSFNNPTCYGSSNGSITTTVSGGTGSDAYTWSNGATVANLSGIVSGTYSVTITDANLCTTSTNVTLTQPSALSASIAATHTSCISATGSASVSSVSGGTGTYTYNWAPAGGTAAATPASLPQGSYTCSITDANGCVLTESVLVTSANAPTVAIAASSNPSCFAGTNGTASVTVSGGATPYEYLWSTGSTSSSTSGLSAGQYNVSVTDANGCLGANSVTISAPAPVAASISSSNPTCYNGNNGAALASASGGTGSYTYLWSNSSTTASVAALAAATYSVTITDANGCTGTNSVTIAQPVAVTVSVGSISTPTCFGTANGSALASATGGTGSFNYSWSSTQTTPSANGLAAGTYSVTASDANGCSAATTVVISQPSALNASITSTPIICYGLSNGELTAAGTGGTTPYTYAWSNTSNAASVSSLSAGTYTVTISDANACIFSTTATITQPTAVAASINSTNNVSCFGGSNGSATAIATGGTGTYSYLWNNGTTTETAAGLTATPITAGTPGSSTNTILYYWDFNSTATTSNNLSPLSPDYALTGLTNATISWTPTGGAYTGTLESATGVGSTGGAEGTAFNEQIALMGNDTASNGNVFAKVVDPINTTNYFQWALPSTGYQNLNLTYATERTTKGAQIQTFSYSLNGGTTWVTNPTNLIVTTSGVAATTGKDTIMPPASATWTQVNVNFSNVTGANNNPNFVFGIQFSAGTGQSTTSGNDRFDNISFTGQALPVAGSTGTTYSVIVTDANGCSATASTTLSEPATAVSATASTTSNVTCYGTSTGAVTATVAGGTGLYTYNWNNGAATSTLTNVTAGAYSVTVNDANGCTVIASASVIQPALPLSANITSTNPTCFGVSNGTATATATGGTGTQYTYLWSNAATTANVVGLANATYTVTLTDVNACSAAATVTITEPSSSVSASVTVTNVSCYGAANGTATVNATGGTGAFTYAWSNSSNAAEITGLANATYTVTVTDTHGCSANTTVAISQPASALTAGIGSFSNASTGENGSISVAASGGTTPYTYSWSSTGANTSTISGLTAGTYSVTITDAHGCSQSTNVTLTGALLLQASISSITNVACNSQSNGSATVTLSGGVAPYTYNWSNGSTTATINSLVAGTYTVTVNDAVGNAQSLTATISQPETLALTLSATNEICSTGGYNGSIVASVTGGTATYSYEWTPNIAAGNNATSLTIGTYSLSVTDGNGCTTSASVTVYGNNTDINNDGITNVDDFLLFINKYNQTCTGCREDINQDGTVNVTDFLIFIGSYNLVCK